MNDKAQERVEDARIILTLLKFDAERANERSALVLLALLRLPPGGSWARAEAPLLGTRAIMDWIRDEYGVEYAPNTREAVRRFTLHQFVHGGLVVENPDDPSRPVNSPKWCYQVSAEALKVIRAFESDAFTTLLAEHLAVAPGLISRYASERELTRIPVVLPDGNPVTLSPGGQNELIKDVVDNFCAYYAPSGRVLYVGDADEKWAVFHEDELAALGVTVDKHGKMPDLVVHLPDKNWLLLLEAAASHGPVDGQRHSELSAAFRGSTAGLVYVSCFPSRAVMRKYLTLIAWETEVWCADDPTHLIHFNGDRLFGPARKPRSAQEEGGQL
ncbi:MAG: restriction endonuclease [Propionibacteriaceae bacterium]|jgi:type II restriction enzyme|nr:restriction endonuclease [Propionibacteriaceae bacterium]